MIFYLWLKLLQEFYSVEMMVTDLGEGTSAIICLHVHMHASAHASHTGTQARTVAHIHVYALTQTHTYTYSDTGSSVHIYKHASQLMSTSRMDG